jgi:hypothetical protein
MTKTISQRIKKRPTDKAYRQWKKFYVKQSFKSVGRFSIRWA